MKELLKTLSKKWWVRLIIVVALAWLLWFLLSAYRSYQINAPYLESSTRAITQYMQYQAELIALEAQYRRDYDGGKTPQETWDLFVAALEAGDTDEAAKYYVPERQEDAVLNWKAAKERGSIDLYLNDFSLIIGGDMYPDGERFEFYTGSIDDGPGFVYMLIKNPYTGVWKIEDL